VASNSRVMETGNSSRGKLQRLDRSRKVAGYMYRIVSMVDSERVFG